MFGKKKNCATFVLLKEWLEITQLCHEAKNLIFYSLSFRFPSPPFIVCLQSLCVCLPLF